ncbi:single myb histone 6-like isoform X1 [Lolium rigidum]|uniref:single myb histone 6-like isoform X1 n=1 Tax=Lolium rigidum TaxID=89674 RepID=UPI001F5CE2F6|nr:single myb histone 6-like isoform X1 [Lolium rigidum]
MGAPKQKWTAEEEAALKAGISKHGTGKWRTILKDPEFSSILRYRSNVDLKDKWRNMNVTVNASGSREKVRATPTPAFKKLRSAPKQESTSASAVAIVPVASDGDDEMAEAAPIAAISAPGKSLSSSVHACRLENIILEAVKTLNEPTGSYKTAIANYIEEQYWPPADFDHVLSAKLNELTSSGKLIKVNRKYRLAPSSSLLEGRSSKMLLLEDIQREPVKVERVERDEFAARTKSQVDAELARMRNMTAEEAAAAAARAVAEAEAIMAEAEAAVREAEAAEADAVAAQAFAEAAMSTLKSRSSTKLIIRGRDIS